VPRGALGRRLGPALLGACAACASGSPRGQPEHPEFVGAETISVGKVYRAYRPAPGDTSSHPSAYLWCVEREGASWGSPVFMAEASAWAHHQLGLPGHSEHLSRWDGSRYGPADSSTAWLALCGIVWPPVSISTRPRRARTAASPCS
jgi:hypothetical protein